MQDFGGDDADSIRNVLAKLYQLLDALKDVAEAEAEVAHRMAALSAAEAGAIGRRRKRLVPQEEPPPPPTRLRVAELMRPPAATSRNGN